MDKLATIHKHFGMLLLVLPIAVVIVSLVKGKTPLPRIVAVLLDVQLVLGIATFALYTKTVNGAHLLSMLGAIAIAHVVAKRDNQAQVAVGFIAVLALLVIGYLFQIGKIPGSFFWSIG